MRRLVLLRHAKADPREPGKRDHDRPLARRGKQDSPRMGRYLAAEHIVPDLALVSDAARTRETFELVAPAFDRPVPVEFAPSIYDADASDLLDMIRATADEVRTLLLIGHNPSLAMLAMSLRGSGDATAWTQMRLKFPTGAAAVLDFEAARWRDIGERTGRLDRFVTPMTLGADSDE